METLYQTISSLQRFATTTRSIPLDQLATGDSSLPIIVEVQRNTVGDTLSDYKQFTAF